MGLIIILPLLVVVLALAVVGGRKITPTQAINEYISAGYLDDSNNQLIWNIASSYLQSTQYENNLIINSSPQSAAVNVYVLSKDPKNYFKEINCNCAYLGQDNIIVCDAKLFKNLQSLIDIPPDAFGSVPWAPSSAVGLINSRFSYFIHQWILGHEIGHLVLGHGTGESHFQPSVLTLFQSTTETPQPSIAPQYEQEADTFAIENLGPEQIDDQFWVWLGLSNMVGAMYDRALQDQGIAVSESQPPKMELAYSSDGHPPWLIRLLDMAQILINTYPVIVDESGYFDAIRESIHLTPDGQSSPLLCDTSSSDIIPTSMLPQTDSHDDYALHVHRGFEYWQLTEYDQSIVEFTSGIDLMLSLVEKGYPPPPQLLEALLQRGVVYFVKGDYENAIADWQIAIEVEPNDPRAYNNIGFAYYELNQLEQAVALWSVAVEIDPLLDDGWAGLGIALYAQGKRDEAINAYQKALKIEPGYSSLDWLRYERSWTEKSLQDAKALLALIGP